MNLRGEPQIRVHIPAHMQEGDMDPRSRITGEAHPLVVAKEITVATIIGSHLTRDATLGT